MDFVARERQFLDHLAPILGALPGSHRCLVIPELVKYARRLGIAALELEHSPPGESVIVASWGDLKRVMRRGWSRIALLEHGIGQSFGGDPASADFPNHPGGVRRYASLFLSPNAHAAGRDQAAYPEARVEIVGCPKLDDLPAKVADLFLTSPVVAVSFHWEGRFPETRSAFGEFKDAVAALAKTHHVIGHAHPKHAGPMVDWYRSVDIPFVADFADVCRHADVYVTEGVSTLYEFASTGRNVVVLNPSFYRRDKPHGLRFDWGVCTDVGINVDAGPRLAERLAAAVDLALTDPPEVRAKREAALDVAYAFRSGGAQRAAEVLVDWASPVLA